MLFKMTTSLTPPIKTNPIHSIRHALIATLFPTLLAAGMSLRAGYQ